MTVPEPDVVYPECEFRTAFVRVVQTLLTDASRRFNLLYDFGLDVAVFLHHALTSVRFFEIKAFGGQRIGGVGFGNRSGGNQVNLLPSSSETLCMFDPLVRWAYADGTKAPGQPSYALFTCTTAKSAAMGQAVARAKRYAKQHGVSVSRMVGGYLDSITRCEPVEPDTPVLKELRDLLRDTSEKDYYRHLEDKYLK